jgi:anionic cell wall polymer biosynthesis LytR-Cps2A-Psr (LCP) family protein
MHTAGRTLIVAIGLALVASACSPASSVEVSSTTATSTPPEPTTTTTTQPPTTTTTTLPIETVRVVGQVPSNIASPVDSFLSAVHDPRNKDSGIDPDLLAHHSDLAGELQTDYEGTTKMQQLTSGGSVAVVTLDTGGIVLLADEGTGWQVVGAHLSSTGTDPWFGEDPLRVLVLGSDARPGGDPAVHRMDSIHVVTSVAATGEGTILGWPRDSWVITPYGEMRINALTSSSRGPDAIFDFFEETWDTQLDGYILTAFSGFEDLIAASVGRLFIELPIAIPTQMWWPGFSSGPQTLSPARSLEYARTRKGVRNGDFSRSKHHGVIMLAVLTMLQQGTVEDVPLLLGELVKYTETNLTPTDLVQLGVAAFYTDVAEITNEVLPGRLGRAGGGASVVFLDPEADGIIADVIEDGIRNDTRLATDD